MKTFTTILLTSAILVSCSKSGGPSGASTKISQGSTRTLEMSDDVKILKELSESKASNLALTELLVRTLNGTDAAYMREILKDLTSTEAERIIKEVKTENERLRFRLLHHRQNYQNSELLKHALTKETAVGNISVTTQLEVAV